MNNEAIEKINPREIGKELRRAREQRGLTQAEAAKQINVARTTMTSIEKGERSIRADELIKLAHVYGRQVSELVNPRPAIDSLSIQFRASHRRSAEENAEIEKYVHSLEDLCRDYLELERITDSPLSKDYPNEYNIDGLDIEQAAESIATQERNRLGLGDGPIAILRDILEEDIGLRVFYMELPSNFSAMYLYDHQLGGCIAVNSLHPEERRRWSLAHDYAHFLVHRYRPTVSLENEYQRLPESERFADYFALFFLMPTNSVRRKYNSVFQKSNKITPADLCTFAHYYGVSVQAITHRLEEMRLLPTGTWERLRNAGFKVRSAQKRLGLGEIPRRDDLLPKRYQYLAIYAFAQAWISEGQFARFLHVDRLTARSLAEELREDTSGIIDEEELNLVRASGA